MHPLAYAEQIAYSSKEVLKFTYETALRYKNKPGCFVETGVAAGAQIIAMAAACPDKFIYAYDSFCGLPWPSNKDNQMPGIRFLSEQEQKSLPNPGETILETTGAVSVSLEDFINHLKNAGVYSDKIIPVRGWFEDTTAGIPKEHQMNPIQILRLDGDLYNSTLVCLQNLYPLLAKGGICIVDDFALPGCRQAVEDYFLPFMKDDPMFSMEYIKDKNSVVAFWYK
jgi:hypothetical protein